MTDHPVAGGTLRQLSRLASELQVRGEQQKSDLARLLHDQLGGLLTAAKMDVSLLQGMLSKGPEADIRQKLAQLDATLAAAMNLKRGVVEQLRPALLEHFGLAMAVQTAFEDTCRRAALQLEADVSDHLPQLPSDFAIALYRVAEACLDNIDRHAQASRVDLVLQVDGATLRLAIADDGIGMDLADPRVADAPGLCGMRQRILSLGGRFDLASSPGGGCRLEVLVPLSQDQSVPRPARL